MNILDVIIEQKLLEISIQSVKTPIKNLKLAQREIPIISLKDTLSKAKTQIISEIKQKSPSEGQILKIDNIIEIAKDFEKNGAAAISVLTDKEFFGGSLELLKEIKNVIKIPVLRKDFIISEYQVYESYLSGADAILLIAEALDDFQLKNLYQLSTKLGMDTLIEFHSKKYLDIILEIKPSIVGVNSRNLETMKVDISWFEKMIKSLPENSLKVAESGIKNSENYKYISALGYDGVLIGTSLMKKSEPGKFLKELYNSSSEK